MFYKLSLSLFLLSSTLVHGTSFYPVPFPTRVDDAPYVVRGTVIRSQPDWSISRDGKKRIYTFTELQVEEVLKGSLNERVITVKELGGEKDGVGLEIPGTAKFSPGEDIVLFLSARDHDQAFEVRGMSTGKYMIRRDENGKEFIETSVETAHELEKTGEDPHGHAHSVKRYTLDQIKELAKKNPEQPAPTPPTSSPASPIAQPSTPVVNDTTTVKNTEKTPETEPEPALKQGNSLAFWMVGIFFTVLLFWLIRRGKK